MALLRFWVEHRVEMLALMVQHLALVIVATGIATSIGVPLGVLAVRRPRIGGPLLAVTSVVQTIPSLAIFGFLLPLPLIGGVGARSALVALILYGLLPVVRTTAAALGAIDPVAREAAMAMGLTSWQRLRHVELPLALPGIIAGIRVSAVTAVGTATIAAAIGAGGLGELIFRGLSMVDSNVILAGALPAAGLALLVDAGLAACERWLDPRRRRARSRLLPAVAGIAVLAVGLPLVAASQRDAIVIGSKNFTEQNILGELLAQTLERETNLAITRRFNLGGTFVCDRAMRSGDLDLYVEYTGTALTAIFKQKTANDRVAAANRTRELYAAAGLTMMAPLGFNNTFAMLVRRDTAERLRIRTLSEAVPHARGWRAGFGYEFLERADGFRGLADTYGLTLAAPPKVMDLSLSYRALASGDVDLIAGDSTAGLISALDLVVLEDDRHYFPPYDAVPVARAAVLLRHPEVRSALERLAGRISEADMRRLNAAVDVDKQDVAATVRAFLDRVVPMKTPVAVGRSQS
jgi:osmoprotectant transport system permease protein